MPMYVPHVDPDDAYWYKVVLLPSGQVVTVRGAET